MSDNVLLNLLKENTNIDHDFLDTFYTEFKIGDDLDFNIDSNDVAKYLGISVNTVHERLQNRFSKNNNYIEGTDFFRTKVIKIW